MQHSWLRTEQPWSNKAPYNCVIITVIQIILLFQILNWCKAARRTSLDYFHLKNHEGPIIELHPVLQSQDFEGATQRLPPNRGNSGCNLKWSPACTCIDVNACTVLCCTDGTNISYCYACSMLVHIERKAGFCFLIKLGIFRPTLHRFSVCVRNGSLMPTCIRNRNEGKLKVLLKLWVKPDPGGLLGLKRSLKGCFPPFSSKAYKTHGGQNPPDSGQI